MNVMKKKIVFFFNYISVKYIHKHLRIPKSYSTIFSNIIELKQNIHIYIQLIPKIYILSSTSYLFIFYIEYPIWPDIFMIDCTCKYPSKD